MENRRFWPIKITRFDSAALRQIAPQLWAEAAYYETEGEPITLQEDLWQVATAEQPTGKSKTP